MIKIDHALCLNTKYKELECRRCTRQCALHCLTDIKQPDWTQCNECGLCLSACPAEAITGSEYSRQSLEVMIQSDEPQLLLSCHRQNTQSSWPCLGFLDARLLLALINNGPNNDRVVVIDERLCLGCRPQVGEYLRQLQEELVPLLTAAGKSPVLQASRVGIKPCKEKSLSRRQLFSSMFLEAVNTVRAVVAKEVLDERMQRHELFIIYSGQLELSEVQATTLFSSIAVDCACNACGLCVRICPEQAISIDDLGQSVDIYHTPQTCTSCQVCQSTCPQQAITLVPATGLKRTYIGHVKLPQCAACREIFQPIHHPDLCLSCLLNGHYENRPC